MKSIILLLFSLSLATPVFSACASQTQVNIDGFGPVYITTDDWARGNFQVDSSGFTFGGGSMGFQFATKCIDHYEPDMWAQFALDETHFDYDVDLSNMECGCNADITFVDMPGPNAGPNGMYYCDGNFVNDQWCPEYDLQESNKYVFVATLHNCDWGGDWFTSCDRGGCQANSFKIDPSMFCPEDRCTINTQKPFHVSHFQNKQIANVYMSQEGREVNFNICNDGGYNEQFWYSYPGMAVAGGMWGGNNGETGWMDGVTGCQSNCDMSRQSAKFYNFRVW